MFESSKAYSSFATDDIEKARQFYGGTLDLEVSELFPGGLMLQLPGGRDTPVSTRLDIPGDGPRVQLGAAGLVCTALA